MTELSGQEVSQPGVTQPSDGSDTTAPDGATPEVQGDGGDQEPAPVETGTDGDTPDGEKPIWNVQVQGHYPEHPENYTIVDLDQPQQ